jgi:putative phosphoesterase
MKIALFADIHANLVALQTITEHLERWRPDLTFVLGDVVNRGPRPAECLRFVLDKQQKNGWLLLRGNHEEYVMSHAAQTYTGVEAQLYSNSRWTYEQLGRDVSALQAWPFSMNHTYPHWKLRVAHASMRHNRDGVYVETPDETLKEQIGQRPPTAFVVGHTHKPLIRQLNGTTVINVGSAGLPFDGDPRVCYAQVEIQGDQWKADLVRLDYDRERAEKDFVETGFMENSGAMARLIQKELRLARSQIAEWATAYEKQVLAGEIEINESVTKFLEDGG